MKIVRNLAMTAICVMLGIMLALQFKSVNVNQSLAAFENKRMDDLKTDLIELQRQKSSLQARLIDLENENQVLEKVKAGDSSAAQQIQENLKKARIFAGLETVKGKGIIVTLDDNAFVHVLDIEILEVVNELRATGAQAISVNEERIVAMTEIRGAGSYMMINGKPYKAPFTIKAIADPDDLERSLTLIGGVVEELENIQLRVSIKKSNEIVIPKYTGDSVSIKTDLLIPVDK